MIPGRRVDRTESGAPIHPRAIAGVDPLPGAVETDALALYRHAKVGFDALAPAFLADLLARSEGRPFLELGFDERVAICRSGLDFGNPSRTVWEAAAAVPFTAFCAAALSEEQVAAKAAGYRVMGLPGKSGGYPRRRYSYGRRFARERTKQGVPALMAERVDVVIAGSGSAGRSPPCGSPSCTPRPAPIRQSIVVLERGPRHDGFAQSMHIDHLSRSTS